MKYTAILVDDEEHNSALLNHFITDYCPEIEVVAICDNFMDGFKEISRLNPEIVFLDIRLGPNEDSYQLMDILKKSSAQIILVTAYEEYASKAFRYSVTDYILKPIKINELIDAIDKAKTQIALKKESETTDQESIPIISLENKLIEIVTKDGIQYLQLKEIFYLEAAAAQTKIFLGNGDLFTVNQILGDLDEQLPIPFFSRVHKSFTVNLQNVISVVKKDGFQLELSNGAMVPISRRKKVEIIEQLSKIKMGT